MVLSRRALGKNCLALLAASSGGFGISPSDAGRAGAFFFAATR